MLYEVIYFSYKVGGKTLRVKVGFVHYYYLAILMSVFV